MRSLGEEVTVEVNGHLQKFHNVTSVQVSRGNGKLLVFSAIHGLGFSYETPPARVVCRVSSPFLADSI